MRRLNSPHLLQVYEVYETKNSLYVVVELLEGGSLYEELKMNTILASREIRMIVFGILSGRRRGGHFKNRVEAHAFEGYNAPRFKA
jgi:serine/threonine protein kinase